jgi:ABC-type glycerol-3-phosphate transport system substrate-binding protein
MWMKSVKTVVSMLSVGLVAVACAGSPTTRLAAADNAARQSAIEQNLAKWSVGINND